MYIYIAYGPAAREVTNGVSKLRIDHIYIVSNLIKKLSNY